MDKPDRVSMIFIASPAEKVWEVLVDPELSRSYFFGLSVEVADHVGGDFVVRRPDGSVDSEGKVLVWDPPRQLTVTWKVVWLEAMRHMAPGRVDYRIEPHGEVVSVTVSEFFGGEIPPKFVDAGRTGWALILSGIKTMLETGRPMPAVEMKPPE